MTRQGPNEYRLTSTEHDADEPAVHYNPGTFPDVKEALDLLNRIALLDQQTACISYPNGDPEAHQAAVNILEEMAQNATDHRLRTVSFDIDLTLNIGEEEDTTALIDPSEMTRLQQLGYIVGTCSDREPTDQRETLAELGQNPQFCIPKEMLTWVKQIIPGQTHLHIGDDLRRDRDIAEKAGWQHQWPQNYQPNPEAEH